VFWAITLLSFAIGFLFVVPIVRADMQVVVSMLNSYSGRRRRRRWDPRCTTPRW